MKRMIVFWCISIGIVLAASILQPAWSVMTNVWTVNLLILLALLLFIEIGLVSYRHRMTDIIEYLQNHRSEAQSHDYLDRHNPTTQNKDH